MKKQYWINVRNVDNRMVIQLDGETIWDSGIIHDDPAINKFIEITDLLSEDPECSHELILEGYNNTYCPIKASNGTELNHWHFNYRIFSRTVDENGKLVNETDITKPYDEKHVSNPHTQAMSNSYTIERVNGDYKIVANSLTQHLLD